MDLSNISVSLSDTSSLDNVTMALSAVDGNMLPFQGFTRGHAKCWLWSIDASGHDTGGIRQPCWC